MAAAATAGLLLAACGSESTDSGSGSTGADVDTELLETACIENDNLGGDLEIPVGVNVALSGQGAYYGDVMVAAAELAADEIRAAGGPDFQLNVLDHKSGDAQAGVATTRELGQAGTRFALYSFIGVLGSAFQGIEQYQILSLDGGGGTQTFGQGIPYFYGTRSMPPNDSFGGIAEWIEAKHPDVRSVSMIIGDTGAENTQESIDLATEELSAIGVELVNSEVVTYGGNDFQTAVTKILAADTDAVISAQFGTDPGYFLKQYRGAGGDAPVIGVDLVPDVLDIAGPEAVAGYTFGAQYFDAEDPGNAWGEHFVEKWKAEYPDKGEPDYYASNYYRDMYTFWRVTQRVLEAGGDVNNPDDVLEAFTSDLTFPDVAGAPVDGSECGAYSIDPETHTVTSSNMAMVEVGEDGKSTEVVATFDVGGKDFEVVE